MLPSVGEAYETFCAAADGAGLHPEEADREEAAREEGGQGHDAGALRAFAVPAQLLAARWIEDALARGASQGAPSDGAASRAAALAPAAGNGWPPPETAASAEAGGIDPLLVSGAAPDPAQPTAAMPQATTPQTTTPQGPPALPVPLVPAPPAGQPGLADRLAEAAAARPPAQAPDGRPQLPIPWAETLDRSISDPRPAGSGPVAPSAWPLEASPSPLRDRQAGAAPPAPLAFALRLSSREQGKETAGRIPAEPLESQVEEAGSMEATRPAAEQKAFAASMGGVSQGEDFADSPSKRSDARTIDLGAKDHEPPAVWRGAHIGSALVADRATDAGSPAPEASPRVGGSSLEALIERAARQSAASRVRSLDVRIGESRTESVHLHLIERQGRIHMAVRSSGGDLTAGLREQLGELTVRLQQSGYQAEPYVPVAADPFGRTPEMPRAGGGGEAGYDPARDSGQSPQDHPQQQQRQPAPEWLFELESGGSFKVENGGQETAWQARYPV